jgi:hypothetical protein
MTCSGMLRRVALVRTGVSEELGASFIRVTRICELGTALAVTSNRRTLVTASVVPSSHEVVLLCIFATKASHQRRFKPSRETKFQPIRISLHNYLYRGIMFVVLQVLPPCGRSCCFSSWCRPFCMRTHSDKRNAG